MINLLTSAAAVEIDFNVEHRVDGVGIFAIIPASDITFTAKNDNLPGQEYILIVDTSGTTSRTLTFSTGFRTTGTLATGTTSARRFIVRFVSDGAVLNEVSRTAAMA